ncbi:hypothetical protein GWK47_034226 [Chionoecetes opilio]|uniref:Uncharacterized protein n=1 Tax=Chionoecetes opilio TaxID=41210 RepID=A0A8J4YHR6_CHIOP|nr:hypothetical protein GWK47_034226 [Chionoecetes opilio]
MSGAHKLGMSLSQRAVRSLTLEAADKKKLEIRSEFSERMVCVKLDLCTRCGRHFLGVNVQAVIRGKLKVVTASVKEMTERDNAQMTARNSSGAECDREENSEEELEGEEAAHNSLEEVVNDVHLEANSVASVRCAFHTLQLCVHDVLLNKVRKIVNKTHTKNMRLIFKNIFENQAHILRVSC